MSTPNGFWYTVSGRWSRASYDPPSRLSALIRAGSCLNSARLNFWVGYVDWRLGSLAGAEATFLHYHKISERLLEGEPDNPDYRLDELCPE